MDLESFLKAKKAQQKADNVQSQLDAAVAAGDQLAETQQARVDDKGNTYTTLKERLDAERSGMATAQAEFDNLARETQTLQQGVNVLNADNSAPATFQLEGKTLTSLGNSNLLDNKYYVLADKKTKVKTFKEDSWKEGVTKFQRAQTLTSTANFVGKVAGSTVENPHVSKSAYASTTLLNPPSSSFIELTASRYTNITTLNGSIAPEGAPNNGAIAQQLFSFNLIEQIERKHGLIPATDKVQWVKDNVASITCNWHGYGSSPAGNKATLTTYVSGNWVTTGNQYATHTNNTVAKLTSAITISVVPNAIDSNAMVHLLAHAEPSDGTTASTINTDYVELVVTLKSTAVLDAKPIVTLKADFEGKVSGSTSENPHVMKRTDGSSGADYTTLKTPSSFSVEATSDYYSTMEKIDGTTMTLSNLGNGNMSQHLFSFNLIRAVEDKFGTIPKATTADKVQWLKDNVAKLTANWHGYGSSPAGNKASMKMWDTTLSLWVYAVTHSQSTVNLLKIIPSQNDLIKMVDSNSNIHLLSHAEASDGVTASTINTDFIDLEVELKPGALVHHPSLPLYEVSQSEYDKVLVDWTADQVLSRYPRVKGSQSIQNPYVMAEGENLLPPFNEWTLHANATVKAPYELELVATGSNQDSSVFINCKSSTQYTFNGTLTGNIYIGTYDEKGVLLSGGYRQGSLPYTLVTESNAKQIKVVLNSGTSGTYTFKNPILTLGSEPKPFVPRNPSYLYAQTNLRSVGDKKDSFYYQDGSYKRRKVVERIELDGSLEWTFHNDYAGYKSAYFIDNKFSTVNTLYNLFNHMSETVIKQSGTVTAPNQSYVSGANAMVISFADTITGFKESQTPTANMIKGYLNGWKYTGDGTTHSWVSIVDGSAAPTQTEAYVSANKAPNYTPYKLSYVLATPKVESVTTEGSITVADQTQIEVGSGVVVREKVEPSQHATSSEWYINEKDWSSNITNNPLKNRSNKILSVYKGGNKDETWSISTDSLNKNGPAYAKNTNVNVDATAEYTVSYLVLDKHLFTSNPADVKATYAKNLRGSHADSVKKLEDVSTKVDVLDRLSYDMLLRIKALEG